MSIVTGKEGKWDTYGVRTGKLVDPQKIPNFMDLSEEYPENCRTLLDQQSVKLKGLTKEQLHWRDHGYVIKRNFIPHDLIDEYISIREKLNIGEGSFSDVTPYLYHSVVRDICCSPALHYLLVDLIGEEMGLHFILADFKSSERGWHQDDYLNPEDTYSRYAAIWMALGDIDPQSGPFEFVPGSHKWPCLRRNEVKKLVAPEIRTTNDHEWALVAEYVVNRSVQNHIEATGCKAEKFLAKKGDILVWHGKLMHRGSTPENPSLLRPAMIPHYSNIRSRRDYSNEITRHGKGGYFWEFESMNRVLTADRFERRCNTSNVPPKISIWQKLGLR